MAKQITIKLGDDNNTNYRRTVELIIPTHMHRVLSSFDMEDDYDYQWDALCDMIENTYRDLPRSWFIDKITW